MPKMNRREQIAEKVNRYVDYWEDYPEMLGFGKLVLISDILSIGLNTCPHRYKPPKYGQRVPEGTEYICDAGRSSCEDSWMPQCRAFLDINTAIKGENK